MYSIARRSSKFRKVFFPIAAFLILNVISGFAAAYQVSPMIKTIEPTGSGSVMQLKITNTDAAPLALELTGLRVITDDKGDVQRNEDLTDLMIFPMQTSIPPGRSQVVQVRYVGDQELDVGRVYAIQIAQLPIKVLGSTGEVGTQVKIGLSFLSHILVQNSNTNAELVISDISKSDTGAIAFVAHNVGKATALLREAEWLVTDDSGNTKTITAENVDIGNFGASIPGMPKRTFKIKPEAVTDMGNIAKIVMATATNQ